MQTFMKRETKSMTYWLVLGAKEIIGIPKYSNTGSFAGYPFTLKSKTKHGRSAMINMIVNGRIVSRIPKKVRDFMTRVASK